jgi:transglutaminase-like putative cysteine protease/tetratricopeptide (TPR) repeat protein
MLHRVAAFTAFLLASASHASDSPQYAAAQDWVEVADLAAAAPRARGPLVIQDIQVRVAGDTVTKYMDLAVKIETPQQLTQIGSLTAQWLPDKGDLVIHRAALVRDGAEIDLLAGERFTVLRREEQLEQRTMTGILTATMPVAGARVGDTLRLSYSVSRADKALGGLVQDTNVVPFMPITPGVGRLRISWPEDQQVRVSAGPRFAMPGAAVRSGFRQIEVALPRSKPDEMPADAPPRFHAPTLLQMTSFADWPQVSRTMAPLYDTATAIAPGGAIAAEVARIAAETADPKARAAAALNLVQDRIAYFANGLDGGNYVPQSAAETWELRYGDCKAKTLLLIAMLRALGLEAEPVLVSVGLGDSVSEALPMPGAFDHVLVRATVGGRDMWLDGTGLGAAVAQLEDIPPFKWALPVRSEGAELMRLPDAAPATPTVALVNVIDLSAGIDFPALYDLTARYSGQGAAMLQQLGQLPDSKERDQILDQLAMSVMGQSSVFERKLAFDPATGTATLRAKGMADSYFNRRERRAEYVPNLPSTSLSFDGNRSRAAWREIPVVLAEPDRRRTELTVKLPPMEGYTLEGATLHAAAAGATIDREASLTGSILRLVEEIATTGGEIAPERIAAEKARFAELSANRLRVRAPATARRAWDMGANDRARLAPIEKAYAKLIADHPDEADYLYGRSSFWSGLRDFKRAIADLDAAIALDPDAGYYAQRGQAKAALGDFAGAIADAAKAAELEPGGERVVALAHSMGLGGQAAGALELVDRALGTAGDDRPALLGARADLLSRMGRGDEALATLAELAAERPGDAGILNQRCWLAGVWQIGLDTIAEDCDAAVTAANFAPAVLDSRALANLRLGKFAAALADADAVLARSPGQEQTLLLRGLVRQKLGDEGGAADLAEALRRRPGLRAEYAQYGLLPAK